MNAVERAPHFVDEEKHFLKALLYFDIFNYPLTAEEIIRFSSTTAVEPHHVLENLVRQKLLFRIQNFYALRNDPELARKRVKGNALAEKKMKTAKRFSRLLASIPFVRAVMLSGSISKGYMDEKSDIDYFIITETNRLWLVRTALAAFRRIFLFNSHKNLCTNYFVDGENLEIREKNIFTAIELCTVKPMYGKTAIEKLQHANAWTLSFLPNYKTESISISDKSFFLKRIIEKVLSFSAVDRFNRWLMNRTISHWKKRYGQEMDEHDFEIAFRSTNGISRSHPQFFQKRVLRSYDERVAEFEIKNGIEFIQ
jgi:hypothetical protein